LDEVQNQTYTRESPVATTSFYLLNFKPMRFISSLVLTFACTLAQAAPLDEQPSYGSHVQDWLNPNSILTRVISVKDTLGTHTSNLVTSAKDSWSSHTSGLVTSAMDFLGVPYKRGGTSAETGFDCSGFVRAVYQQSLGLLLPRRADEQAEQTAQIPKNELRPGDLVFFNTMRRTFSHVGIYVGDNKFIHSPRTGARVRVDNMDEGYWNKRFTGARRVSDQTIPVSFSIPSSLTQQSPSN
jgi:cell wall-associated NlpC family hydrolase